LPAPKQIDPDNIFEPYKRLLQVMQNDPLIHERVIQMLKLDSYQRRSLLNNWLEQLRTRNASENLLGALSCLFDDKIAKEVLTQIIDHKIYLRNNTMRESFIK
jgi:hypothetical protein